MLGDEGAGGLKCPLFSQHSSTSGGGVLATTGVSELPSYFSKSNNCEKKKKKFSVKLKSAEFTKLAKNLQHSGIYSEASSSYQSLAPLPCVTISRTHFAALSGSEIQETSFSGWQAGIILGYLCSSEVTLPLLPISPAAAGLEVGLALVSLHPTPATGRKQQRQLPVLSHTPKFFFWINFTSLHVIRKQECLWLCLAKTRAGGIVRSKQSGFAAISTEELCWLTNVYPSYSNFYSEQS